MTHLEAVALLVGFAIVGGNLVILGLAAIWSRWNRDVAVRHELEEVQANLAGIPIVADERVPDDVLVFTWPSPVRTPYDHAREGWLR